LIICLDLEHLRTIKSERHHRLAQEHGLLTYAVSAKARVAAGFSHYRNRGESVAVPEDTVGLKLLPSVADPDPLDPYAFGPPGSGSESVSQRYVSGS
jgi:hypothetical protein